MCAGLETMLRCNIPIYRYYYSDTNPIARTLAVTRLRTLQERFPSLLPSSAFQHVFMMPQDINEVDSESLLKTGANNGRQWLVIAGWECQDLSNAGSGRGLKGQHSSTFFPLINVCASLQLLQPKLTPAFVFENTSIQTHRDNKIAIDDFNEICAIIGQPVLLDAARFGSGAHRLRNFWTNLANPTQILTVAEAIQRNPNLTATMYLDPNRIPLPVDKADQKPFYPCNKVGLPRAVFPTLVSFSPSMAFRDMGPGMIYDNKLEQYLQPNVTERERMMGYLEDSTFADKLTTNDRQTIIGKAMDANCLEYFFTICVALYENKITQSSSIQFTAPTTSCVTALTTTFKELHSLPQTERWWHDPNKITDSSGLVIEKVGVGHALAGIGHDDIAEIDSYLLAADKHIEADVWGEPIFLNYLKTKEYP